MRWHLPPMNALRAFEATARNGSMLHAAQEMNVTQSAVSKQIKLLEEWLGDALFERMHREIRLTRTGETYFSTITSLFAQLDKATRTAISHREKVRVRFLGRGPIQDIARIV